VCNRKAQEHVTLKKRWKIYSTCCDEYGQLGGGADGRRVFLVLFFFFSAFFFFFLFFFSSSTRRGLEGVMHAVRVCREAEECSRTKQGKLPRRAELLLRSEKGGSCSYKQVAEVLRMGPCSGLESAQQTLNLTEKPEYDAAEIWALPPTGIRVTA